MELILLIALFTFNCTSVVQDSTPIGKLAFVIIEIIIFVYFGNMMSNYRRLKFKEEFDRKYGSD